MTRNDLRALLALALVIAIAFAAAEVFDGERPRIDMSATSPAPARAELRRVAAVRRNAAAWERAAASAAGMSVRELAGQRTVASFRETTVPPAALVAGIRAGRIGGILLFTDNVPDDSAAAFESLSDRLQRIARAAGRPPLLIAVDQESAAVARIDGPPRLAAAAIGRLSQSRVRAIGRRTARLLRRAGVHVDLAPVADVSRGPASFMDERSFSRDWRSAGRAARAFALGLQSGGVAATAKHYPGLGAALASTDAGPVSVAVSRAEARRDLAPFAALVEAGAKLVMMSSAIHSSGGRPAVLEPGMVASLRRLGFGGVVVSDALDAGALAPHGDRVAIDAASAGVDLFLWARGDGRKALEALVDHAEAEPSRVAAMREAATRVLYLKEWVGLRTGLPSPPVRG
jgi:beta-N-acetylhexosaminidase